jgi:hypothetical protein
MQGDGIEAATLAALDEDWLSASEHVRANARSLATRELRELFRFRDTRAVPLGPASVAEAIDLAAKALIANVSITHPVVLGRILVALAPVLDPAFPLRTIDRR